MIELGSPVGYGAVVKITVETAHTFVSVDINGRYVLNHNLKQEV